MTILPLSEAREIRDSIIEQVARASTRILLEPTPGPKTQESVWALDEMLTAAMAATKTLSTSSHPSYAERDLPGEVQDDLARARHNLKLLQGLYGPQVASV